MSLRSFRAFAVTILATAILVLQPAFGSEHQASAPSLTTQELLETENCIREGVREVSVPEIRGTPIHDDVEYPAWQVNWLPKGDLTQLGGHDSFNYVHEILPGDRQVDVVRVSNERFKTAEGWADLSGGEWLKERLEIAQAPEYRDRSECYITRPLSAHGEPLRDDNVDSTYILTWGEYTEADIKGKTDQEIVNNTKIRFPEEKTLQKPIHRYDVGPDGKGIEAELRAVSIRLGTDENGKTKKITPSWLRDEGLFTMIQKTLKLAKNYPGFYEKPWITFYADEGHRVTYENWIRVALQEQTTPEMKPLHVINKKGEPQLDRDWWYVEVSPKTLEEVLISRAKGGRMLSGLNLPHPVTLPNGHNAMTLEGAPIAFDSDGNPTLVTFRDKTELPHGVVAAPKSTAFLVDNHLVRIDSTAEPYTFKHSLIEATAPAGSTLEWDSPYLRAWLSSQTENVFYKPNIGDFARPHALGRAEWRAELQQMRGVAEHRALQTVKPQRPSDPNFVTEMNKQARIYRKNWGVPDLSRMVSPDPSKPIFVKGPNLEVSQLEIAGDTYVFRMAKDSPRLDDGVVAAQGTDLEFEKTATGLQWTRVCLAQGAVVQGHSYKKGTVLIRLDERVVELTKELTELVPYSQ